MTIKVLTSQPIRRRARMEGPDHERAKLAIAMIESGKGREQFQNFSEHSAQRLNTLVKGILLRRTKQQVDVVTKKPIVCSLTLCSPP